MSLDNIKDVDSVLEMLDTMKYRELQGMAKEIEENWDVEHINKSVAETKLRPAVRNALNSIKFSLKEKESEDRTEDVPGKTTNEGADTAPLVIHDEVKEEEAEATEELKNVIIAGDKVVLRSELVEVGDGVFKMKGRGGPDLVTRIRDDGFLIINDNRNGGSPSAVQATNRVKVVPVVGGWKKDES